MDSKELRDDFLKLARIALTGRQQDIQMILHRIGKRFKKNDPDFSKAVVELLSEDVSRTTPLRKYSESPLPVDLDSRLHLLKVDTMELEHEPVFPESISQVLKQVISERENSSSLHNLGLLPTKTIMFTGPPGVGKTLTARWLASKLNMPLLILDLAGVMSSYLGRTGNNVRFVLDYAKKTQCVLLIDELDSIAKRRDDSGEIGELKRLVNVLLQEIDDWPASGLLLAATNHPDLLDPAIWRRFEMILNFGLPDRGSSEEQIKRLLSAYTKNFGKYAKILSYVFSGLSFSDIERQINQAKRDSAISGLTMDEALERSIKKNPTLSKVDKLQLASILVKELKISQRQARELTGLSRDTIRNHINTSKTKR